MDLFKYHNKPETLNHYSKKNLLIPAAAYDTLYYNMYSNESEKVIAIATIAKDPEYAVSWAKHTEKPFPAGEHCIATKGHARDIYAYAEDILLPAYQRGEIKTPRFIEAEHRLAQNGQYACKYAEKILFDRFPEAEDAIAQHTFTALDYVQYVLVPLVESGKLKTAKFPKGEAAIATEPYATANYARFTKERFIQGEHLLATAGNDYDIKNYNRLFGVNL
jgi:hypothetical protein